MRGIGERRVNYWIPKCYLDTMWKLAALQFKLVEYNGEGRKKNE